MTTEDQSQEQTSSQTPPPPTTTTSRSRTTTEAAPAPAPAPGGGPLYHARDLETRARRWGTRPSIIRAAFKAKGVEALSLAEAEAAVKEYMGRQSVVPKREPNTGGQA
jgi:hypothetical protein